jgi:hypothetical protein
LNTPPSTYWFADWQEESAPAPANIYAAPTTYKGIGNAQTQLNLSASIGKPLGLKVEVPLTGLEATQLFNTQYTGGKAISYVFGDFEQTSDAVALTNITNLVSQVRGSTWSTNAFVGQWNLTPVSSSDERMGRKPPPGLLGSALRGWGKPEYDSSKVNMANSSAYPGSANMRNKSTNDWANGNIRTGLFLAPIGRVTDVQNVLDSSYKSHVQIPWVSRFNNFGNNSLDNADLPGLSYVFQPGAPLNNGYVNLGPGQTANQMLGRGDFSAQILHYRHRGAYSVNLFEPGVVGYTKAEMQQDVRDGWFNHSWNNRTNQIFAASDHKYATMTLNPVIDGTSANAGMRTEQTGTVWSGQYSLSLANPNSTDGKGALDVLVSNLDTVQHLVKFGKGETPYDMFLVQNGSGYTYADHDGELAASRNYLIQAGMHKLLQFDLVKTRVYNSESDMLAHNKKYSIQTIWLLNMGGDYTVFNNNNRNEMGIPEPTTFGALAAAGAISVVCRRQRRKA